jgi:hypothetical protein
MRLAQLSERSSEINSTFKKNATVGKLQILMQSVIPH